MNQPQETQVKNRRNCKRTKNRRENILESRKEQTEKKGKHTQQKHRIERRAGQDNIRPERRREKYT